MIRIQQNIGINAQSVENQATSSESTKPATSTKLGLSEARDSFEISSNEPSALRNIIQNAKAEAKIPMTQNNVNRFIQNNLKPEQYPETFRDLKGWVSKNFYLTSTQKVELNSLSEQDVGRIQQGVAKAAQLNKPLSVLFGSFGLQTTEPKQLVLAKIIEEQESASHLEPQNPEDRRKEMEQKIKEMQERMKEMQKELQELKEASENDSKPFSLLVGGDNFVRGTLIQEASTPKYYPPK